MRIGIRQEDPGGVGRVVAIDDEHVMLATFADGNPLGEDGSIPDPAASATTRAPLILWSGSLGETLFAPNPLTWMRPGREALDRFCAEVRPRLEKAGMKICFRPHARHVLSDPPSCLRFMDDHAGEPFAVALAPGAMLEPGMLPDIDDHLQRSFEMLGPRCRLLILHDVAADEQEDGCRPVPLGEGRLPRDLVRRLIDRYIDAGAVIVLHPGAAEPQLEWLGRL